MNLEKTVNNIVWYVPFKKLRNSLREYLINLYMNHNIDIMKKSIINSIKEKNKEGSISDNWIVFNFRDNIFKDENFLIKYKKLINGLDEESINFVQDLIINKVLSFNN